MARKNGSRSRRHQLSEPSGGGTAVATTDDVEELLREVVAHSYDSITPAARRRATPPDRREVLAQTRRVLESAAEALRAGSGTRGPLGAVAATPSDITDELEKGGPAFGAFVKAVGLAVADAQQKLDETLVTTAKALSDTQIDVIAVFEQEIDNDGKMTAGVVHQQKLPLINYLMPTAYQWSRVFLQSDMQVREFNAANGFNIKGKSSSVSAKASAGYGTFSGFSGSGSVAASMSSYSAAGETSVSRDEAAGSLHMEATLEPRADVQLPRPFILQKGPTLKVSAGARSDITDNANPPAIIGRRLSLTIELRDKANVALPNKRIEQRISDPLINYSMTPANGQTDATGTLVLELRREGGAFDRNKPAEAVTVSVWLGLINQQVVVNI